jgi:hypothetical protein
MSEAALRTRRTLTFGLLAAGLAATLFSVGVFYGLVPDWVRELGTCGPAPEGQAPRLLGFGLLHGAPSALWGLAWFGVVLTAQLVLPRRSAGQVTFVLSILALAFVLEESYVLLSWSKAVCIPCFVEYGAVLGLFLVSCIPAPRVERPGLAPRR